MVVADGKVLAMARQTPLFAVLATFLVLGIATMFWSAPRIQANVNQELTDRLVSAGITDAQVITRFMAQRRTLRHWNRRCDQHLLFGVMVHR